MKSTSSRGAASSGIGGGTLLDSAMGAIIAQTVTRNARAPWGCCPMCSSPREVYTHTIYRPSLGNVPTRGLLCTNPKCGDWRPLTEAEAAYVDALKGGN